MMRQPTGESSMRIALIVPLALALIACGDKDSGPTADTTSSTTTGSNTTSTTTTRTSTTGTTTETTGTGTATGSGTGTTGTGGTTPTGTRNGTYIGSITVTIEDIGFIVNTDTCAAPLTIELDEALVPQLTSLQASCTMTGSLSGQTVEMSLQGDLLNPTAFGDVNISVGAISPTDTWNGTFVTLDTLEGRFEGDEMMPGGTAGTTWDATFTATR